MTQLEESVEYLLNENKRLQTELSTAKLHLFESQSESSILLETVNTQHHTLDEAVKQLESFSIGSNINHKYKKLQKEYNNLQERDAKHQQQNTILSYQLSDSKLMNTRLEDKLLESQSNAVLSNNQIEKKNVELNRISEIKRLLEIELKSCIQKITKTNNTTNEHSETLLKSKQQSLDFKEQADQIKSLKVESKLVSDEVLTLRKENQQLRSDSGEKIKTLISSIQNFDAKNGKMDCLMDELDRKDTIIQELRRELQVKNELYKRVDRVNGMHTQSVNKENHLDTLMMHSRYSDRNQNSIGVNQKMQSHDLFSVSSSSKRDSNVLHVNDTFIREEKKQVTNTIDNVMLKIDKLERELNGIH